jgi:ABC-type ATPase with predicted acetyltransferase domain
MELATAATKLGRPLLSADTYYFRHKDAILRHQHAYYRKNRKRCLERNYEYARARGWDRDSKRNHQLNGKRVVGKRIYPADQKCELCFTEVRFLAYHHWDDSQPRLGIWCCTKCHRICEAIEKPDFRVVVQRYRRFKNEHC